ncbi:hypothetical protein F5X98DRAFT_381584 [Xylaria grammica]|nr:hypothetical protein F5X98DRAFT_381584 [Xylaria grammica]
MVPETVHWYVHNMLGRLASGLAARLVASGVSRGAFVPVCSEKPPWTTVAILGILKAGTAFIILDPAAPELRSRLADQVIVFSSHVADGLYGEPHKEPDIAPDPSSPMYVVFTSGSAGTPKGAITHANLASALFHQAKSLRITSSSRSHDREGGCLCVPNELDRQNKSAESIALLRANTVDLTPSVSRFLRPEQFPSLQQIIFGGEAPRVEDMQPRQGRMRSVSLYGPCECTPNSTINSHPTTPGEAVHMGKGVGLNTWIADPKNHDIPLSSIGDIGELLLEGPLVGSSYLNEPEKTAAAQRGRLYKTSGLVRYNKKSSVSPVGRKDEQVKIRGPRAELGEIEHVIRGHSKVKDAVVVLKKNKDRQEPWLAGFVMIYDKEGSNGATHQEAEEEAQHVEEWEKQFSDDCLYSREHRAGMSKASKYELRYIMNDMRQAEAKLLVDPAFFTALPDQISGIEHVEILPKKMRATNEASAYRYKAVIHVTASGRPRQPSRKSLLELLQRKLSTPSAVVAVSNIPNGRIVSTSHVLAELDTQEGKAEKINNDDVDWLSSAYAKA